MKLTPQRNDPGRTISGAAPWPPWLMGLGLLVMTLIAFGPAWHAGFIWDDFTYITDNPLLTASDGLRRIWFSLDAPSQYFPLTFTSFRFERGLWGLDPTGYHVVNIFLHAANALLLWRVLARLRVPAAWFGAALFALHPVQVESVAWVTERKNVLMGFFFLLALYGWLRFINENAAHRWSWYILALVCQGLSLSAKTTACTLPAALLLILWLEKKPIGWRQLAQVGPFLAMGIGMGLVTIWWERYHQGTHGELFGMGPVQRLLLASRAIWFYAGKLLWPVNLTFSYPRWKISATDPLAYGWLLATIALAVVIWRTRRWTGRGVEVAAVFFVATLGPMLGFIMLYTFVYSFVADHYQYLACIGPLALAAAGLKLGLDRLAPDKPLLKPVVGVAILLTLGVLTWRQCETYKDLETLWRTTIARNPDGWLAFNDLGVMLYDRGETDEAIRLYRKSVAIDPNIAEVHNNLGAALDKRGQLAEAALEFEKALVCRPAFPEAERNLGDVLLRQGKVDEAILHFRRAILIRPEVARPRYNLADIFLRQGQPDEAIRQYREELEYNPNDADGHYNLGVILLQQRRPDEAIVEFQKTVALRPNFAEAQNDLGYGLLEKGRTDEALTHLAEALKIHPDFPPALFNLGNALLQAGRTDEAIAQFQRLVALQPNLATAKNALNQALLRKRNRN